MNKSADYFCMVFIRNSERMKYSYFLSFSIIFIPIRLFPFYCRPLPRSVNHGNDWVLLSHADPWFVVKGLNSDLTFSYYITQKYSFIFRCACAERFCRDFSVAYELTQIIEDAPPAFLMQQDNRWTPFVSSSHSILKKCVAEVLVKTTLGT